MEQEAGIMRDVENGMGSQSGGSEIKDISDEAVIKAFQPQEYFDESASTTSAVSEAGLKADTAKDLKKKLAAM